MRKTLTKSVVGVLMLSAAGSASAELFVNPVAKNKTGASEISAHFGSISVDYEANGGTGEIDRTFLGASFAHGMNSSFDVYGTFSLTLEAELEGVPSDGDGYILGAGLRGVIPNNMGVDLNGYAQLLLISEDYGFSIDGDETSIMFGAVASKAIDDKIKIYGGVEFNLWSDMDIEGTDADRDDFLGFRLGANFNVGEYPVNTNLALIHESGIFISASKGF